MFGANVQYIKCSVLMSSIYTMFCVNVQYIQCSVLMSPDFPKLAEKLLVIRTDRHEDLVRPKNILPV